MHGFAEHMPEDGDRKFPGPPGKKTAHSCDGRVVDPESGGDFIAKAFEIDPHEDRVMGWQLGRSLGADTFGEVEPKRVEFPIKLRLHGFGRQVEPLGFGLQYARQFDFKYAHRMPRLIPSRRSSDSLVRRLRDGILFCLRVAAPPTPRADTYANKSVLMRVGMRLLRKRSVGLPSSRNGWPEPLTRLVGPFGLSRFAIPIEWDDTHILPDLWRS